MKTLYFKTSFHVDQSTFSATPNPAYLHFLTFIDPIFMGEQESSVTVGNLHPELRNLSVIADSGKDANLDIHLQTPELISIEPQVTCAQTPELISTEPQVSCVQTPEPLSTNPKVTLNISESIKAALLNSLGRRKSPSRNSGPLEDTARSSVHARPILSPGMSGRRGVKGVAGFAGHWQFIGDAAIMNSCLKIFKVSYFVIACILNELMAERRLGGCRQKNIAGTTK